MNASASPSDTSRWAASRRKSRAVTCAPPLRAWAQASEPLFPAPRTSTRCPGRASRATHAGAPQTSRTASAVDSGRSSGNGAHSPVAKSTARPRTSRRSACRCTARTSSRTRGVSVSDTSVAMRSPFFSSPREGCAAPTSATRPISIPPEPVTGFCIFPRAPTISRTRAPMRRKLLVASGLGEAEDRPEQVDRHREDGGAGFLGADLDQGLQIAKLQRRRVSGDHVRRHAQLLGRLVFAFRRDHLRAPLALRLGLAGHRALHLGRQVDGLDLDRRDLDAPGLGVQVENLLELLVDLLALREQVVEIQLAERAAQRGLRELGGGVEEVLHLDDGLLRVDHAEVDHRGDLEADVVAGDHVLGRDVPRHRAQVHLHHPVDARDDPVEARALHLGEAAEPEDDAGFVLLDDPQAGDDPEQDRNREEPVDHELAFVSAAPSGATSRVSPCTARTRAREPGCRGWALAAFHSSPATRTVFSSRTSPISPISEKPPARSGWRELAESFQARGPAITAMAAPTGATMRQPSPKSASA